jgi:hypothetical protein
MKEQEDQWFTLELAEIIRVNQLVRRKIDFDGFTSWFEELSVPERCSLTTILFEFAYQAGVDESTYDISLATANIGKDNSLAERSRQFFRTSFSDLAGLHKWLQQLPEDDRFVVFKLGVYLFGQAEGRVYDAEKKDWCNHWWHRDLLDERVVNSLINDQQFYRTAMRDDDRLKSRWQWLRGD